MGSDDSQGKSKAFEQRARYTSLIGFFLIGLCIGVVVSGRIYVQRSKTSSVSLWAEGARQLSSQEGGSSSLGAAQSQSKAETSLAVDFSKPARNDLETLLRKVI